MTMIIVVMSGSRGNQGTLMIFSDGRKNARKRIEESTNVRRESHDRKELVDHSDPLMILVLCVEVYYDKKKYILNIKT